MTKKITKKNIKHLLDLIDWNILINMLNTTKYFNT